MDMTDKKIDKPFIWVNKFKEEDAAKFVEQISKLEESKVIPVIPIYIDSYGGSVDSLMVMLEAIGAVTKPVATIGIGKVMSASTVLLSAGNPGMRYAGKNCRIMIHEVSSAAWGKISDVEVSAREIKRLNKSLLTILVKNMNISYKKLLEILHKRKNCDWYMTANEAKKYGLIDHIRLPLVRTYKPEQPVNYILSSRRTLKKKKK